MKGCSSLNVHSKFLPVLLGVHTFGVFLAVLMKFDYFVVIYCFIAIMGTSWMAE